jgi:diadenosine tetraphosphate (Ap4A) HIT family hydrolase
MTDSLKVAQQEGRAPWTEVEIDTREFVVYRDIYPVTPGHTLVVPKENTEENILKCFNFALSMGNDNIRSENNNITGYNVGINMGKSAGQTCLYPHVHLIFRRDGDMEDPAGGVRGVIPSKQKYTKKETDQTDMFEEQLPVGC